MTVGELQKELNKYPPESQVRIYDQEWGNWLSPDIVVDLESEGHPGYVGIGFSIV